jgi:hypothetical protein
MKEITIKDWSESFPISLTQPVEVLVGGEKVLDGTLDSVVTNADVGNYFLVKEPEMNFKRKVLIINAKPH